MKKDISYKSLIIGSAVYILCGLVIRYLAVVCSVLSYQEAQAENIDPRLTTASDYSFILSLFITFGGLTFIFWLTFLLCNIKWKFWSLRTFGVSFIVIFIYFYISYSFTVDDNFAPSFNDVPPIELAFVPVLACTVINYIAFLIAMAIAYRYVLIKSPEE